MHTYIYKTRIYNAQNEPHTHIHTCIYICKYIYDTREKKSIYRKEMHIYLCIVETDLRQKSRHLTQQKSLGVMCIILSNI